mgnify:CR=1 FL=1
MTKLEKIEHDLLWEMLFILSRSRDFEKMENPEDIKEIKILTYDSLIELIDETDKKQKGGEHKDVLGD